MNTLLLIFWMLITPTQPNNDLYYVIKVKGTIINKNSGKILVPGDQIKSSDQLSFSNATDQAIVLSSSRGKFTLAIPQDNLFDNNTLLAYADKSLSPVDSRSQLATRSLAQGKQSDLKNYFGNQTFYIIGKELSVALDETKYPLNPSTYLSVEYFEKEQKSVKVKNTNQTVTLALNDFRSTIETQKHDTIHNASLYHYDNQHKLINKITDVNMVFLDEQLLNQEFKTIISVLKQGNMDPKEINAYIFQYFIDIYGQTDNYMLNQYIGRLNP